MIIGVGLGDLPTAYELRRLLPQDHAITVISVVPDFTFIPSLPWVAMGLKSLASIQLPLAPQLIDRKIGWILDKVDKLDPKRQQLGAGDRTVSYDYLIVATGAELALDAVPGLGPDQGYTHFVCNPHNEIMAKAAWQQCLQNPGLLVVGAGIGGMANSAQLVMNLMIERHIEVVENRVE